MVLRLFTLSMLQPSLVSTMVPSRHKKNTFSIAMLVYRSVPGFLKKNQRAHGRCNPSPPFFLGGKLQSFFFPCAETNCFLEAVKLGTLF